MAENNKLVVGKRKDDNQNAGKREAGKRKIVLVGNPNAGKTTLFNALTGRNEKVGNWHGVTVESVSATARLKNETAEIIDVPKILADMRPYRVCVAPRRSCNYPPSFRNHNVSSHALSNCGVRYIFKYSLK